MKEIAIRRASGGYVVQVCEEGRAKELIVLELAEVLHIVARECGHIGNVWLEPVWMMLIRPAVRWRLRVRQVWQHVGDVTGMIKHSWLAERAAVLKELRKDK